MSEESPKKQSPEDKYLADLESRKLDQEVVEADIPNTETLVKQPADAIALALTHILRMGNIIALHLEVGKPLHVKFYKQTSFGKGKLDPSKTLLSPEAIEEAARKKANKQ